LQAVLDSLDFAAVDVDGNPDYWPTGAIEGLREILARAAP